MLVRLTQVRVRFVEAGSDATELQWVYRWINPAYVVAVEEAVAPKTDIPPSYVPTVSWLNIYLEGETLMVEGKPDVVAKRLNGESPLMESIHLELVNIAEAADHQDELAALAKPLVVLANAVLNRERKIWI